MKGARRLRLARRSLRYGAAPGPRLCRATVTVDKVLHATAQLATHGRRVTGNSLRSVIGQGRPECLLAVWQEQQGQEEVKATPKPEARVLPPAVTDHLAEVEARVLADLPGLVVQGWRQASDLASRWWPRRWRTPSPVWASRRTTLSRAPRNPEAADERATALADEPGRTALGSPLWPS